MPKHHVAESMPEQVLAKSALMELRIGQVNSLVGTTKGTALLLQEAAEAIVQSQARYRRLVTRMAAIVFELAVDGTILFVNEAIGPITGYQPNELAGRSWWETFFHGEARRQVDDLISLFQSGDVSHYEMALTAKNGATVILAVNSANRYGVNNGLEQIIGFGVDITDRRRAEDALRIKDEQLRQAQKMEAIGRLASGIAHDFNNLLTVINGYSELALSHERLGTELRQDLEQVKACGFKAALLTRQLLAFSRKQVLEPKVLDLNKLVGDIESLLRRIIGEDIALLSHLDPALKPLKVDPGQMDQVIMNLAVNARDAMPRGGRLLIETKNVQFDDTYTRLHSYVKPGAYVMLAMSDTGEGMRAETRSRIFEPFFTTKEPGKGTGLGLSTVYGIVKQSGGSIEVYSEEGTGTTFKIYLPQNDDHTAASNELQARLDVLRGTETILLVEDDDMVRALARVMLERLGYAVLHANNGAEALRICLSHSGSIHLLITDVVMPGMSGRELAGRLLQQWPAIKVLYMSGFTDDAVILHGLVQAEHSFLQKPFSSSTLASKVRHVLDSTGMVGE